ncbi:MAG: lipase family alpha/beta hydrolase [Mycobacteriaceae bacterium]
MLARLLGRLPAPAAPWADSDASAPATAAEDASPIVLVHGSAGSRNNFEESVPVIRESGRPVLSVSYGHRGTADIRWSLEEVAAQLGVLSDRFGTLDLVGHSQGGLLSLAASGILNEDAGRDRIGHVVGLAADFRGVARPRFLPPENPWLRRVDRAFSPSFADQLVGSEALREVLPHTGRSSVPVTQIMLRGDRIVPADRARAFAAHDPLTAMPAHRGPVRIVEFEDHYPDIPIGHATMPHRESTGRLVVQALASAPCEAVPTPDAAPAHTTLVREFTPQA